VKAVLIETPHRVSVVRLDDPTPAPQDAIVQVEACGICGTDIHVLEGDFGPTRYPIVPGHEFCGEVVAVGAGVSDLRVGEFVAVDPSLPCGRCFFCRRGRGNLCENWNAIGVGAANCACAELVRVPATSAFALPGDMPRRWATLVEPLACAVRGFDQIGVRLADSYLIYGAGTMGLLLAQLAAHAGAGRLDVIDVNPGRLNLAGRLGADRVGTSADALEQPRGWDVVIDATGAVPAIEDGLRRVRRGGTFLVFGVASAGAVARFSPFRVYNDEINIIGSMAVLHSFERARDLLVRGVVDCQAMITHRYTLDAYADAIRTFRSGEGLKVQVSPATST
jgi:2-desacetyl-2-hydroxyethyl bacteriochlorophyllide A dehydrogenase